MNTFFTHYTEFGVVPIRHSERSYFRSNEYSALKLSVIWHVFEGNTRLWQYRYYSLVNVHEDIIPNINNVQHIVHFLPSPWLPAISSHGKKITYINRIPPLCDNDVTRMTQKQCLITHRALTHATLNACKCICVKHAIMGDHYHITDRP